MKLFFSLIFSFSIFVASANELIDEKGHPTPPLLSLFELLDIPSIEAAKKNWRQRGERWDFEEVSSEKEDAIHALLKDLGVFDQKIASKQHYKYGIVLGALIPAVRIRLGSLLDEWNRGVRFDYLVFLTGQRPLHVEKESIKVFLNDKNTDLAFDKDWVYDGNFPKNETEMMRSVFEQAALPEEIKKLPLIIIDAPPIPPLGRPTTESTVIEWLKTNPEKGSCLFFSAQPFVGYQDAILRCYLDPDFSVETVGRAGGLTFPTAILLDTVAKWLFWELQQGKK